MTDDVDRRTNSLIGTMEYMAPEIVAGEIIAAPCHPGNWFVAITNATAGKWSRPACWAHPLAWPSMGWPLLGFVSSPTRLEIVVKASTDHAIKTSGLMGLPLGLDHACTMLKGTVPTTGAKTFSHSQASEHCWWP